MTELVKKIVDEHLRIKESLKNDFHYEDIPVEKCFYLPGLMSESSNIQLLYFMVCLEPESISYGRGIGAFVYKGNHVYRFNYNIHTPHSKGPHRSNQMTNIQEVVWFHNENFESVKTIDTHFGDEAFQTHTSLAYMDEEAKSLRLLMKSLQDYCRKQDYCKILRSLDKAHEQWKLERDIKTLMTNTCYGATTVVSKGIPKFWCTNQTIDSNGRMTCLAHLAEGRALNCPYANNEERLKAEYPCQDYEERRQDS